MNAAGRSVIMRTQLIPDLLRQRGDRQPNLICIEQITEIDSGPSAEAVISPCSGVDVKKLVFTVSRIQFVFNLNKSVVIACAQETLGQVL